MLPESLSVIAKTVVRTHHENDDGTGYPRGLDHDGLHIFARIVRIADAFDAATSHQVYRAAKSSGRVLWEMTEGPYKKFYDPVLIRVLARLIQPFPIGAKLRLSDGRYAVVVRYNRKNPFQPHVLIGFDADDRRLAQGQIEGPLELHDQSQQRIAAWGAEDTSYIYSDSLLHPKPVVASDFETLFEASYP